MREASCTELHDPGLLMFPTCRVHLGLVVLPVALSVGGRAVLLEPAAGSFEAGSEAWGAGFGAGALDGPLGTSALR